MDQFTKLVSDRLHISPRKARSVVKKIKKAIELCEGQLQENPFDRTVEELSHEDMLSMRNFYAENGLEYTPQEVNNAIEILIYIRSMIRE